MKKFLFKVIFIIFILLLFMLCEKRVYATDLVDFSKAIVSVEYSENAHLEPSLKVSGIDFNPNNNYYVQYTNSIDATLQEEKWNLLSDGIDISGDFLNAYVSSDDIYVWFNEADSEDFHIYEEPIKLERNNLLPFGNRINAIFTESVSSIRIYEYFGNENRKINYSLGEVTDLELLKEIQKNGIASYDKLLDYAKNSDVLHSGSAYYTDFENVTLKDFNLTKNGYYFMYFELDTENGKYIELEDIGLYRAVLDGSDGYETPVLLNTNDSNFEWVFEESSNNTSGDNNENINNPTNNTVIEDNTISQEKLPQTGMHKFLIKLIIFISIAMSITIYYISRRYRID